MMKSVPPNITSVIAPATSVSAPWRKDGAVHTDGMIQVMPQQERTSQYQPPPRDMHDGRARGQGPRLCAGWRYHCCALVSATIETFQRTLRKTQLYPNACGSVSSVTALSPCTWLCA